MRNEFIGMSAIESVNAIHHQERLRNKSSLTAKVLEITTLPHERKPSQLVH